MTWHLAFDPHFQLHCLVEPLCDCRMIQKVYLGACRGGALGDLGDGESGISIDFEDQMIRFTRSPGVMMVSWPSDPSDIK